VEAAIEGKEKAMNGLTETNTVGFENDVLKAEGAVLVDFYAPWCGPCKLLGPALEKLAPAYGERLRIVKVNVDESPDLAVRYGIRGVPSLLFFRDGELVDTVVGLPSFGALRAKLDQFAGPAPVAAH
jgi:thioredoxin 1